MSQTRYRLPHPRPPGLWMALPHAPSSRSARGWSHWGGHGVCTGVVTVFALGWSRCLHWGGHGVPSLPAVLLLRTTSSLSQIGLVAYLLRSGLIWRPESTGSAAFGYRWKRMCWGCGPARFVRQVSVDGHTFFFLSLFLLEKHNPRHGIISYHKSVRSCQSSIIFGIATIARTLSPRASQRAGGVCWIPLPSLATHSLFQPASKLPAKLEMNAGREPASCAP